MVKCLVGLGSNLGHSREILDQAVDHLSKRVDVQRVSGWYDYPSIGPSADDLPQPDFLNGVILLETTTSAHSLAEILHEMERTAGRDRTVRWSSRTLDADLLIYGDAILETADLIVPHPRMMSRRFVLEPACDVAGELVHPTIGWTLQQLFDHLLHAKPLFVVLGDDEQAACQFAQRLAEANHGTCYSIAPSQAGLLNTETIRLEQEKMVELGEAIRAGNDGPWFANFWIDDPTRIKELPHFRASPKLILLLAARGSVFAEELERSMEQSPELRVPVIYLSPQEQEAWQDALGAVQGMQ